MSATPFEIWWLVIIPVCFAAGWLAARIDIKHLIASSQQLPKHYFKGLHFLLTEQADKAIDAFIEVAKIDSETVELHFALGNLFRRRGELERAIRVHQNLLSRQDLSLEQKQHALYELGQNYLKAGLLDRAEETLNQLDSGDFVVRSQKALIEIYQREKEWHKAIATAKQLEQIGEGNYQKLRTGSRSDHARIA